VSGNSGSDFKIKLLVVHPDGRRQKFLVTFPERRSLKIDQRYIGLPITLKVDFVPGAIVCRPGTGHTLTVGGKPAKDHTLSINDTVGLDQYSIEFLELPEPLPMEEATRFVNINEIVEATVVAALPRNLHDDFEATPVPKAQSNAQPPQASRPPNNQTPFGHQAHERPKYQPEVYRPDPEDSTAIIRRLQVPGSQAGGQNTYSNYSTLQPSARADATATGTFARNANAESDEKPDEFESEEKSRDFVRKNKYLVIAGAVVFLSLAYLFTGTKDHSKPAESTELASEQSSARLIENQKIIELPEAVPAQQAPTSEIHQEHVVNEAVHSEPAPNNTGQAPAPMSNAGAAAPINPFDEANGGFDPMATAQFFAAVDSGDEAKIKELVEKRVVDVNLSRKNGYAALHLAAANGDLQVVKSLIRMKADVNALDGSGATPLMWAVFRKRKDVVKFLATKTDLKIERQGGETAYALAKRMKQNDLLKLLEFETKKKTARKTEPKKRLPSALPEKKK
jgi:hypothetical protein